MAVVDDKISPADMEAPSSPCARKHHVRQPGRTNGVLLALSVIMAASFPGTKAAVPVKACTVGYLMDTFCIKRGTLLDNWQVKTLEKPELHSVHCLVDVGRCVESGFEVLAPPRVCPEESDGKYCRTFKFDTRGNTRALAFGQAAGSAALGCWTCTGGAGALEKGLAATVRGEYDPDDTRRPRVLTVTSIEPASVGCPEGDSAAAVHAAVSTTSATSTTSTTAATTTTTTTTSTRVSCIGVSNPCEVVCSGGECWTHTLSTSTTTESTTTTTEKPATTQAVSCEGRPNCKVVCEGEGRSTECWTVTTAPVPTTVTTMHPTTSPATTSNAPPEGYSCAKDRNCLTKKCDANSRACSGCKNKFYLSPNGVCVERCQEGQLATGEGVYDRRCWPVDSLSCDVANSSPAGCKCPSSLGKCDVCRLSLHTNATCVSCADGVYAVPIGARDGESPDSPVPTRCRPEVVCRGSKLEEDPTRSCNCKTEAEPSGDCFRCRLRGGLYNRSATKTCTRCRNSKYLSAGRCVDDTQCPVGEVPTLPGTYGRKCQPPFECKGSRVQTGSNQGKRCKCVTGCQHCSWTEEGTVCFKCRNNLYLTEDKKCVPECLPRQASVGVSAYGRYCADAEVNCVDKRDTAVRDRRCTCPRGCTACTYSPGSSAATATCSACSKGRVLREAACEKK